MELYNFYYSRSSELADWEDARWGIIDYKEKKVITPNLDIILFTSCHKIEEDKTVIAGDMKLVATCELALLQNDKPANDLAIRLLKEIETRNKLKEF